MKKGVICLEHGKKKKFVEPELTKYEKRLDEVTLCFNGYMPHGPV